MAKYAHYRTDVPGRVPDAADMEVGEIAMNTADQILFTKTEGGDVVRIATGTYTKAEMDTRYVPQGILPVTRIGDLTTGALPVALNGSNVEVTTDIPVLLMGRYYTLAAGLYPFTSVIAGNTGTKTLNVYVTLSNAQAVFEYSFTSLAETVVRVFVGTVTVTDTTPSNLILTKVSRLDIYRPSVTQVGSAFPVSPGTPDKLSQTNW